MGWPEFHELSRRAGGVVPLRATAEAAGLAPAVVRRRAREEAWWWPFPDVVATPGVEVDSLARARAAVLCARGRTDDTARNAAVVSQLTAAYLLGVHRSAPTRPHVMIDASRVLTRRGRASAGRARTDGFGFEVMRGRFQPHDVAAVQGVPILTGPRLVRDLAAVCGRERLRSIVIDLAAHQRLDLDDVRAHVDEHRRFAGRPVLRQVLDDLARAGRTDSPLEFEVRRRFEGAGVPLDRGQVPVPLASGATIHCDLGILAIRFGIEVDSMGFHSSRTDLATDATRTNAIAAVADRWRVMRVTWELLRGPRWDRFVGEVREVIALQSRLHLGVDWPRREHLQR